MTLRELKNHFQSPRSNNYLLIIISQVQVAIDRDEAEKENGGGGGLSFLESGVQGLSLNPIARAQDTDAAAKTPVAARSTRSKAAPRKPVKRVMLRDK